ncbi:MAG: hypothetical protein KGJ32_01400 [Xanthomonadaceae bacterium]|nr:hypothetical protein [Xanthomonadaceae bacterium]
MRVVANAIANFLYAHPSCADSIEGIEQWWLRPQGITPPVDVIARALDLLEMEQVIESRRAGSHAIWRLRKTDD